MRLEAIHPNTTLEEVLSNMSFVNRLFPVIIVLLSHLSAEQLRLIREEIDPDRLYAGG